MSNRNILDKIERARGNLEFVERRLNAITQALIVVGNDQLAERLNKLGHLTEEAMNLFTDAINMREQAEYDNHIENFGNHLSTILKMEDK